MAVLLFLTFAAWSMGSAVGGTPDEGYVLTSIWCGKTGATPDCEVDPNRGQSMLVPVMVGEPQLCFLQQGQDYGASCQQSLYGQQVSTQSYDYAKLYPETYMNVARKFVGSDIDGSVVRIRLFNSFIACVMILFALSINRRRDSDLFISWLAVIAPVTTYFISSVNTSSWTIIGTTCFVFALIAAVQNRRDKQPLIAACLLTVFSVWFTNSSRYEGKYVLLLLGAAIIYSEFAPKNIQLSKKTALVGAAILSILFFIYNYFADVFSRGSRINIFSDARFEVTEGVKTTANNLLLQNFLNLPRFIMGFFGGWGLGWFDVEMTHTVWLFALQAFLLTTVFALYKSDNVRRSVSVGLVFIMFVGILLANQQKFSKIGNEIQPRYFLPFFLGIVIIAAANKTARFPNSLVLTVAILATISNSIALRDTIRRYTTGQDVFISKSLNNPREWWWNFGPAPETVWLVGSLAFAMLFAVIIYERKRESAETANI